MQRAGLNMEEERCMETGGRNGAAGGQELGAQRLNLLPVYKINTWQNQELNLSSHFSFHTIVPEQTGIFALVCLSLRFLGVLLFVPWDGQLQSAKNKQSAITSDSQNTAWPLWHLSSCNRIVERVENPNPGISHRLRCKRLWPAEQCWPLTPGRDLRSSPGFPISGGRNGWILVNPTSGITEQLDHSEFCSWNYRTAISPGKLHLNLPNMLRAGSVLV